LYDTGDGDVTGAARWGPAEAAWRAQGYVLEDIEGLRAEEMELVALAGVVPCLFLSPLATSAQRERAVARALLGASRPRALTEAAPAAAAHDHTFADVEPKYCHWRRWESWR
jgi:hypothetical protein